MVSFRGDCKDTASGPSELGSLETSTQGLKVVAEGEQPVLDVIAIHGLNGHCDKTWTATNGVHWLRDLLPTDIPNARTFCWGYDANTHGKRVSHQSLHDHAEQLASDLCLKRKRTNVRREQIFREYGSDRADDETTNHLITHNVGGIVMKGVRLALFCCMHR
ncbi:hypothetical protein MMC14_009968 [Varicellaria rhodocarpa]|nr:hypothetical protein [Varicellaria rhodocarpa]